MRRGGAYEHQTTDAWGHHVALRVSDVARAKRFYTETLGFSMLLEGPDLFRFVAGGTAFGVRGPTVETPAGDRFNPCRVDLDHTGKGACEAADRPDLRPWPRNGFFSGGFMTSMTGESAKPAGARGAKRCH